MSYRGVAFSSVQKELHDKPAKKSLIEFICQMYPESSQWDFFENEGENNATFEDGFWDLEVRDKNGGLIRMGGVEHEYVRFEVERKNMKWWGYRQDKNFPFKYDGMDVPYRKDKNSAHYFILFSYNPAVPNMPPDFAFMTTRKHIDEAKVVGKNNSRQNGEELFFRISCETGGLFFHRNSTTGKWKKWGQG